MKHNEDEERENDRMGKCHNCGDSAKIIAIDINGDWPAKFVPATACCEADFEEYR